MRCEKAVSMMAATPTVRSASEALVRMMCRGCDRGGVVVKSAGLSVGSRLAVVRGSETEVDGGAASVWCAFAGGEST